MNAFQNQSPGGPGSLPGDLARQVREGKNIAAEHRAYSARGPRQTWQGGRRIDLTLSLRDSVAAREAAHAVARAAPMGATISAAAIGYWQGEIERAYVVSVVSDDRAGTTHAYIVPLVAAAHAHGCRAVQVEVWSQTSPQYSVSEWRPARAEIAGEE